MTEQTSTEFPREGRPAFPVEDKGTDKPAESLPAKTDTTQTPSPEGEQTPADPNKGQDGGDKGGEDKNRGFADDPRWQERETDWKNRFNDQEKRHVEEMTKLREEITKLTSAVAPKGEEKTVIDAGEVPPWFNGDEDQWKQFMEYNRSLIAKEAQGLIETREKSITEKQQAETKAVEDATKYFNSEVAALEADKTLNPKGEKIDRNKLLKTALDNDLVDSQGRWNYKAAYRLLQQNGAQATTTNTKDRKDLAGATIGTDKADAKTPNVTSSEEFSKPGGRPW